MRPPLSLEAEESPGSTGQGAGESSSGCEPKESATETYRPTLTHRLKHIK